MVSICLSHPKSLKVARLLLMELLTQQHVGGNIAQSSRLEHRCQIRNWFFSTSSESNSRWLLSCLESIEHGCPAGAKSICEKYTEGES